MVINMFVAESNHFTKYQLERMYSVTKSISGSISSRIVICNKLKHAIDYDVSPELTKNQILFLMNLFTYNGNKLINIKLGNLMDNA